MQISVMDLDTAHNPCFDDFQNFSQKISSESPEESFLSGIPVSHHTVTLAGPENGI
jgi:hypothetical protein